MPLQRIIQSSLTIVTMFLIDEKCGHPEKKHRLALFTFQLAIIAIAFLVALPVRPPIHHQPPPPATVPPIIPANAGYFAAVNLTNSDRVQTTDPFNLLVKVNINQF